MAAARLLKLPRQCTAAVRVEGRSAMVKIVSARLFAVRGDVVGSGPVIPLWQAYRRTVRTNRRFCSELLSQYEISRLYAGKLEGCRPLCRSRGTGYKRYKTFSSIQVKAVKAGSSERAEPDAEANIIIVLRHSRGHLRVSAQSVLDDATERALHLLILTTRSELRVGPWTFSILSLISDL